MKYFVVLQKPSYLNKQTMPINQFKHEDRIAAKRNIYSIGRSEQKGDGKYHNRRFIPSYTLLCVCVYVD